MNKFIKNPFLFTLVIYTLIIFIFLIGLVLEINKKTPGSIQSEIPSLATGQLQKAFLILDKKEKIDYSSKIELDKFNFGKAEPFSSSK